MIQTLKCPYSKNVIVLKITTKHYHSNAVTINLVGFIFFLYFLTTFCIVLGTFLKKYYAKIVQYIDLILHHCVSLAMYKVDLEKKL